MLFYMPKIIIYIERTEPHSDTSYPWQCRTRIFFSFLSDISTGIKVLWGQVEKKRSKHGWTCSLRQLLLNIVNWTFMKKGKREGMDCCSRIERERVHKFISGRGFLMMCIPHHGTALRLSGCSRCLGLKVMIVVVIDRLGRIRCWLID